MKLIYVYYRLNFFCFWETFENPESDDDSTIEQEEEQQPEFKYDIDVIPNEENIEENMGEEFINAEEMIDEDMGEMGEQTIEFDKQSRGLDSISMSKKRSRTSLLSLPIQHICVYKKILNKINYFNRITQTEKCILRVSRLLHIHFCTGMVYYHYYNTIYKNFYNI